MATYVCWQVIGRAGPHASYTLLEGQVIAKQEKDINYYSYLQIDVFNEYVYTATIFSEKF